MAPKSASLFFALLSLMAVAVAAASRGPIVGGWKPIADPNATEIIEIAKFAVAEHNKVSKTSLVFVSVVKGETQVVAGINYRLVISTKSGGGGGGGGGGAKTYTAVVYSRAGPRSLSLTSFEQTKG